MPPRIETAGTGARLAPFCRRFPHQPPRHEQTFASTHPTASARFTFPSGLTGSPMPHSCEMRARDKSSSRANSAFVITSAIDNPRKVETC